MRSGSLPPRSKRYSYTGNKPGTAPGSRSPSPGLFGLGFDNRKGRTGKFRPKTPLDDDNHAAGPSRFPSVVPTSLASLDRPGSAPLAPLPGHRSELQLQPRAGTPTPAPSPWGDAPLMRRSTVRATHLKALLDAAQMLGFEQLSVNPLSSSSKKMTDDEMRALYWQFVGSRPANASSETVRLWVEVVLVQLFHVTQHQSSPNRLRTAVICLLLEHTALQFPRFQALMDMLRKDLYKGLYYRFQGVLDSHQGLVALADPHSSDSDDPEALSGGPVSFIDLQQYAEKYRHMATKLQVVRKKHRSAEIVHRESTRQTTRDARQWKNAVLGVYFKNWHHWTVAYSKRLEVWLLHLQRFGVWQRRFIYLTRWKSWVLDVKVERLQKQQREALERQKREGLERVNDLVRLKQGLVQQRDDLKAQLRMTGESLWGDTPQVVGDIGILRNRIGSLGDVTQDLLVQRAEAQAAAGEAVARLQKHRNIMDQMLTVSVHTVVCLPGETDPALGHRPPRGSARALLVAAREKAQHPSQPWAEPDIAEGEEGDVFTDEELEELQVEWLLLAWFNAMLRQAGHARCIYNFGSDLCDMENYIVLLSYCFPEIFPMSILNHVNPLSRAERVINKGRRMGMGSRIRPSDIVESNVEANLAFICWVFDQYVDSNGGPFVTHEQQEALRLTSHIDTVEDATNRVLELERLLEVTERSNEHWGKIRQRVRLYSTELMLRKLHGATPLEGVNVRLARDEENFATPKAAQLMDLWPDSRPETLENEMASMTKILKASVPLLKKVYQFYATLHDSHPHISLSEFLPLCEECNFAARGLTMERLQAIFTRVAVRRARRDSRRVSRRGSSISRSPTRRGSQSPSPSRRGSQMATSPTSPLLDVEPGPDAALSARSARLVAEDDAGGLTPALFVEALVRIAEERYAGVAMLASPTARLQKLLVDALPRARFAEIDEFKKLVYHPKMQMALAPHCKNLSRMFLYLAGEGNPKDLRSTEITEKEFAQLWRELDMVDKALTKEHIHMCFVYAQCQEENDEDLTMCFREFVEAIVAVAMFRMSNPLMPPYVRLEVFLQRQFFVYAKIKISKAKLQ